MNIMAWCVIMPLSLASPLTPETNRTPRTGGDLCPCALHQARVVSGQVHPGQGGTPMPATEMVAIPVRRLFGRRFENQFGKIIEALLPMLKVVGVIINVPDVRDVLLLQVGVDALADANQAILVAA